MFWYSCTSCFACLRVSQLLQLASANFLKETEALVYAAFISRHARLTLDARRFRVTSRVFDSAKNVYDVEASSSLSLARSAHKRSVTISDPPEIVLPRDTQDDDEGDIDDDHADDVDEDDEQNYDAPLDDGRAPDTVDSDDIDYDEYVPPRSLEHDSSTQNVPYQELPSCGDVRWTLLAHRFSASFALVLQIDNVHDVMDEGDESAELANESLNATTRSRGLSTQRQAALIDVSLQMKCD